MPCCQSGTILEGLPVDLFVVTIICEPLISQPIDASLEQNTHLAELQLADWTDQESKTKSRHPYWS